MADGSVVFSTALDNTQLENDLAGLKQKVEKEGSKGTKAVRFSVDVSEAEKNLRVAMDRMQESIAQEKELQRQADNFSGDRNSGEFKGLLALLDQKREAVRAAEKAYHDAFDRANGRGKYQKAPAEVLDAQDIQKEIDRLAAGASSELNRMRRELEEAENALKGLEAKGKWFGDEDFDRAYQKLALIKQEIKEYKAELTEPVKASKADNPFGLDTLAGKIREAELRLKHLTEQGKGLGDADYNAAYRDFARLKAEETALKKQLAAASSQESSHLREIADNAQVADQHIVSLNEELAQLKARQKELEQANAGLGYQEYDQNTARIAEITRQLKEYQKALAGTGSGPEEQVNRTAAAAKKLNGIIAKMSPALGKKTSEIAGQVLPVIDAIAPKLSGQIVPAIEAVSTAIGGVLTKLLPVLAVAKLIYEVVKRIVQAAVKEAQKLLSAVRSGVAALYRAGSTLAEWLSGGVESAGKFGSAAASAFAEAVNGLGELMSRMNMLTKLSDAIGKKLKRLGQMIRRVFVFSVITSGLRAIRSQISAYLGMNEQLTTALRRLQGALLTAFQPIYDVVVPALTTLVNVLSQVIATISQFFAALFGTTAKKAQENAKALYGESKALQETGAAAEEAAGSLAGFDEINTIQTEKKSGGGGGAGGADTSPLFDWEYDGTPFDSWGEAFSAFLDKLLAGLPKLEAAFKKFADWLNDLAKKLYDMFTFPGVLDKVKALGKGLAEALNKLVNWIDWHMLGKALGAGLNLALNFLTEFLYAFDWFNLGKKLAEFVNGLVSEIDWYEFGRLLWAGFKIALETLAGFLVGLDMPLLAKAASDTIRGFFDEMYNTIERIPWGDIGKQLTAFLNNIDWYGSITVALKAISAAFEALFEMLDSFVRNLQWGDIAKQIYAAVNDSLGLIDWRNIGQTLGNAFTAAFHFATDLVRGIDWHQIGSNIADFILGFDFVGALSGLGQLIAAGINAAVRLACGFLDTILPELRTIAEGVAEGLRQAVAAVDWHALGDAIGRGIQGALTFVSGLLDPDLFYTIGRSIGDFLTGLDWVGIVGGLAEILARAVGAAVAAAAGFLDSVQPDLKAIADGIAQKINEFVATVDWAELGRTISRGVEAALDFLIELMDQIDWDAVGDAIADFLTSIDWSTLLEKWGRLMGETISAKLKAVDLSGAAEVGANLVAGIVKGWQAKISASGGVLGWLKSLIADPIINGVKTLFGIHSPSTVFAEIGENLIAGLLKGATETWNGIENFFREKAEGIQKTLSDAWDGVKATASEKWGDIKTTLSGVWGELKTTASTTFTEVKNKISEAWTNAKTESVSKWTEIKTTVVGKWTEIRSEAQSKFGEIKSKISEIWSNVKTEASQKWSEIKTTAVGKWTEIRDEAKSKFEEVRGRIGEAWDNIKRDVPGKLDGIKSAIKDKWDGIVSSARSWGSDLCSNLASGIEGAIGKVKSAARSVADKVSEYLHFSEPDVGPLSNFHTFMPDMLQLMAKGIYDNTHLAVSAASELADSIANAVSGKSVAVDMTMPDISQFSLPLVAQGAKLPASRAFTMAVQGENGSAASLARMEKLMGNLLERMGNMEIVVHNETKLDGKTVARNTVRHINDMTRSAGRPVIDF